MIRLKKFGASCYLKLRIFAITKIYEGTWMNDVAKCGEMMSIYEEPEQLHYDFPKVEMC